jgi:hypothetical protein
VQTHAEVDWTIRERVVYGQRGSGSSSGRREGDEEGIPLRIDLDAAVCIDGLADDTTVLGQRLGEAGRPNFVQEPRRSLYVGEEEGDVPVGKSLRTGRG